MAIETDNELKADFLTESQELIERVSEQMLSLERHPEDRDLLNAIFRGFHTIKGSAGFFDLQPVVALAHAAEDIFGLLREGKRSLTPEMLDAVLETLDTLRSMLDQVARNREPECNESLVSALKALVRAPAAAPVPKPAVKSTSAAQADPFSDDEFEALLDQLQGRAEPPAPTPPGASDRAAEAISAGIPVPEPMAPVVVAETQRAAENSDPERNSVRVDTQRLDQVMDLVGELVLVRNRIKSQGALPGAATSELRKAFSELDVVTSGLQTQVTRMRMQPIRKLFARFPKLARDTARKLGKQVELERVGEDTELDKTLVEALGDPLMHMVRNAVDHGLESPEVRVAAGKAATGHITLSAEQSGGQILITVSDDGAGMNPDRLRAKALERGLIGEPEAARLSRDECLQLVFLPGFSTKEQVSDLSGRGVGMDVVRSNIVALGGAVSIESEPGKGSRIRIRVPLTLAIQPVLMVERDRRLFALPLQAVEDVFALEPGLLHAEDGGWELPWEWVPYRKERLRLLRLSRWTGDRSDNGRQHVVVVNIGGERYGLLCGIVRGREEIVVKPLGRLLKGLAGVAGGTVTSEGRVALIVELPGLLTAYERDLARTR
jgi:two-component system chemotaxis sensor kinase CheA